MERYYKLGFRLFSYLLPLTSYLLLLTSLTSCQEGHEAGDLFGQWRLDDTKHLSFSGSIASFRSSSSSSNNNWSQEVFANFQHVGDSLFIQCSSIKQELADTLMVENDFGMKPFTNIRVKIDAVDSDHLLLSKDGQQWSFKKW